MRSLLLIVALALPSAACFSAAVSVGGTVDATGQIDWVGQFTTGLIVPTRDASEVHRAVVDLRSYRVDGRTYVGAAIGADRVTRPIDGGLGHHLGFRVGGAGPRSAPRATTDRSICARRSKVGVATGWVEADEGAGATGRESVGALTIGPVVELGLHRTGARPGSHLRLGARLAGELARWSPVQ
jgi:hypothetical protein